MIMTTSNDLEKTVAEWVSTEVPQSGVAATEEKAAQKEEGVASRGSSPKTLHKKKSSFDLRVEYQHAAPEAQEASSTSSEGA